MTYIHTRIIYIYIYRERDIYIYIYKALAEIPLFRTKILLGSLQPLLERKSSPNATLLQ